MVLFSHGVVNQWEKDTPVLSRPPSPCANCAHGRRRRRHIDRRSADAGRAEADDDRRSLSLRALRAGADFMLIGNNMMDEQEQAARYARDLREACETDALMRIHARRRRSSASARLKA